MNESTPTPNPVSIEPIKLVISAAERWFFMLLMSEKKATGADALKARDEIFAAFESAADTDNDDGADPFDFYRFQQANVPMTELLAQPDVRLELRRSLADTVLTLCDDIMKEGLALHFGRHIARLATKVRAAK